MKKFMNKNVLASLCLAALIALLPACGCGDNNQCKGGVCPVAAQVTEAPAAEENKSIDATNPVVEAAEATDAQAEVPAPTEGSNDKI
jgi:hypothetical protein